MVPLSVLDLAPIVLGGTAAQSLRNTLDLARQAERWGYHRYWLAEHHNMTGIASAATAVVIGHVAGGTSTIRVGAGGIMLPNHSPLVIAEQFGTLATLYPDRIDLGLGRAPGTDQATARALRRYLAGSADSFPEDVLELQGYFRPAEPGQAVRAVPGAGLNVPLWLLGSSLFSARLAAEYGLPFAFASHFAPDYLLAALRLYRAEFKPSEALSKPHAMVAVNVFAADTDAEAWRLSTSIQQMFAMLQRGRPGPLPPPLENATEGWTDRQALANGPLAVSVIGTPETVRSGLESLIAQTGADELIVTSHIFEHAARLRSFELIAEACHPERMA
ncbi:LLM class flavin-dependent oxidoreductase [bacterium]|nr:LLM class flavin-dependent oxidoreductase [bacterium]